MLIMSSEEITEVKNAEATVTLSNEVIETTNEEQPTDQFKKEPKEDASPEARVLRDTQPIAKAKATPKKLARTVKVVELVECQACQKKMLPKEFEKHTSLLL